MWREKAIKLSAIYKEYLPEGLLVILVGIVTLLKIPHSELTSDDGAWLLSSLDTSLFDVPFWMQLPSSQGTPQGALAVYLHKIFLGVNKSMFSVYVGARLFDLGTCILFFSIGKLLESRFVGLFAAMLYVASPIFSVFYAQKCWQVAYLPFFSTLTLWLLIAWWQKATPLKLALITVGIFCSLQIHASAILFLMPILWVIVSKYKPFSKRMPLSVLFSISLAICLAATLFSAQKGSKPIEGLYDVLSFYGPYLNHHVGNVSSLGVLEYTPILPLVFAAALIWGWLNFDAVLAEFHILVCWCLLSVLGLFCAAGVFQHFPHHWYVFLLPGLYLLLAGSLESFGRYVSERWNKQFHVRNTVATLIVLSAIACSMFYWSFVRESGGVAWHLASLSTKSEVIDRILAVDARPNLVLAVNPRDPHSYQGIGGWAAALRFGERERPAFGQGDRKYYFVFEQGGLGFNNEFLNLANSAGLVLFTQVKNVFVFTSDHPFDDFGVLVPRTLPRRN